MSRIPIASLANGVLFATQTFASPSNPSGVPVLTPAVGVQCFVYVHDTATPAAIWTDELGSTPLIAPLTTDATGTVPGWIDTSLLPLDLIVALPSGNATFILAGGGSGGGGGGAIASVFGRTGSITAQSGDYTASLVGADAAGSAAVVAANLTTEVTRAQGAEAVNATAISTETTRAQAAESRAATSVTTAGTVSHPTELLDATSTAFTRTLPTAVGFVGSYRLVAVTTGLNVVTIATSGGQTITAPGGIAASTLTLGSPGSGAPYEAVTLVSDNSNWRIV